ncbi:uncharacterized protein YggE [Sphingomonas kyeonggiensis]|uniref:Uncharacterized protein YggE n=1 Tax=Sphingomonas kyeonggiensis TaxID=1268553 RepID=A0A7W7K295_9SPHN|nr:SIMPL domain-containing protein [Sphingomonas kyeonggiensis]MBB4839361.1 uncharacterized protein YggE [Sphingomonas kyeonggiensis]
MRIRMLRAALLALPFTAFALPAAAQEVRLKIVGDGVIDRPASVITATATFWGENGDPKAMETAREEKYREIVRIVAKAGLPASAVVRGDWPPLMASVAVPVVVPPAPPAPPRSAPLAPPVITTTPRVPLPPAPPRYSPLPPRLGGSVIITFTSPAQLAEVRAGLQQINVGLGSEQSQIDDEPGLRREAKTRALAAARADADAYARSLGYKTIKLVAIDEAGQLLPPSVQRLFENAPFGRAKPAPKPGLVHIEESVIVEFVLTP